MARGFVRAEVLAFVDLAAEKGPPRSKRKGRLEGRGYVVQDGDILTIRFAP
jgi:ribosome-binding ATPase YchF (GTP1/OBG family)